MNLAIWWIRRDLRLTDNQALQSALDFGDRLIPIFILDSNVSSVHHSSTPRFIFLKNSLLSLHKSLLTRGSSLTILSGDPIYLLTKIVNQLSHQYAVKIFAEPDYSPYAIKRDAKAALTLPVEFVGSPAFFPPGLILKNDNSPYTIFTPFSRIWKSLPISFPEKFTSPEIIPTLQYPSDIPPEQLSGNIIPEFIPTEDEGKLKLSTFLQSSNPPLIYSYVDKRNALSEISTSRLSPYLRFGLISIRQVVKDANACIANSPTTLAKRSAEEWLNELIWRDFYIHTLYHFPQSENNNFRNIYVAWRNDDREFDAWCQGKTGYPIVDAAMRQLNTLGWIPNRARMIVASFLTKDLLIDWRWGEKWFMDKLIDGDPAANIGGWQWSAGTGTDAAPYFRIINPILQSQRYDPQGEYIKQWLPELKNVTPQYIHEPFRMPMDEQERVKCQIGKNYPYPIVNHYEARNRAMQAFRIQKESGNQDASNQQN